MKTNKVIYITSNIIITIVKYDHLLKFNVDEMENSENIDLLRLKMKKFWKE